MIAPSSTRSRVRNRETENVHLSYSQIRCYSGVCSLQWLLSRRYKAKFCAAALHFGGCFHRAVQAFAQHHLEGQKFSKEDMMLLFRQAWLIQPTPIKFGKKEDEDSLLMQAARMIDVFFDQFKPGHVVAVEEPFTCHMAEGLPPLVGHIDLVSIEKGEDGKERLVLTDFKTSARKPSEDSLDHEQLALYAIGAQRTGMLAQFPHDLVLRYAYVTKTKSPEVIELEVEPTHQEGLQLIEKARQCWRGMSQQIVFPNRGWQCAGCGYQEHCKQWPDLLKPDKEG